MAKRPHIIIFNPDEMRADALHHLGNEASITPNLDKLIEADGQSFSNAYCQNPVCVPSRCSFFTGLYPHVRGHRTMSYLLHPGEDSLLKELKDSGYYVWMNDRNDLTAGQIEGWTEAQADEIFIAKPLKTAGPLHNYKGALNSKFFYSHFNGKLGLDENGKNYTADDQAVDAAINLIQNPKDDRPLCIFLGLNYPHVPYQAEEPYFSAIDRQKLKKRIDYSFTKDKSAIMQEIHRRMHNEELTEDDWNEIRATYLAMCMKVDESFGKLIKALKEKGIYDDTAIFFLSDHGDFTGDYSLVEKAQNTFEDCLTRVPFLIKPPASYALDPGVNPCLTELVDFYATVLDMAGIKSSHTHFGRSLVNNLKDRALPNRDFVCSEGGREPGEIHCDEYHTKGPNGPDLANDYYPRQNAQRDDLAHAKGIMIRDYNYKYISRTIGQDEFYDLRSDPNELINQINNPQYKDEIQKKEHNLLKWLERTADIVPFQYDERFTKPMMLSKISAWIRGDNLDKAKEMIDKGCSFSELLNYCIKLQSRGERK